MAGQEPQLLSLQLKVNVLPTAPLFLEIHWFTRHLSAHSVLCLDAKMVRRARDLHGAGGREQEGGRKSHRLPCRCDPGGGEMGEGRPEQPQARAVWRLSWPGCWLLGRSDLYPLLVSMAGSSLRGTWPDVFATM